MKVLIISDTHYGVRGDNVAFYDYQKKFMDNVFFRFIKEQKPDAIIHLGDLVDNRRVVNYRTHDRLMDDYLKPMAELDIEHHWLVGNHDSFYKNTLKTNAVDKFTLSGTVHSEAKEINIKGVRCLFVPWICQDNEAETMKLVKSSSAQFCFGHLEIDGFEVRRGSIHKGGSNRSHFAGMDTVFSGHFHNRSHGNNIRYIGSAFQFDWSDYGEYKGMALLETETSRVSYFRNPYNMFNVLNYDENDSSEPSLKNLENTYVRLVVKSVKSKSKLDDFISQINDCGPVDLKVIDHTDYNKIVLPDQEVLVDEVKTVCHNYIDALDIPIKNNIQEMFDNLYRKSI